MTLDGIFSSATQRRTFLLASGLLILVCMIVIFAISHFALEKPVWNTLNNLLTSVAASGIFAIFASLFIFYFFVDPNDIAAKTILLSKDIGQALKAIAQDASDYKIFVRTGRHFRAEILPILVKRARERRHSIRIEVILLDLRDIRICKQYADFRKDSSFDRKLWDTQYVQNEVAATILALARASQENPSLINTHVFLSKRLSTFRIEGSQEAILVTREDPKDTASQYSCKHRDFSAFTTEISWVRNEAEAIQLDGSGRLPSSLQNVRSDFEELEKSAEKAMESLSPYVR